MDFGLELPSRTANFRRLVCTLTLPSTTHSVWLDQHFRDLLDFGMLVADPDGGAGYLDSARQRDRGYGVVTFITARMVHIHSVRAMLGVPGCRAVASQAMAAPPEGSGSPTPAAVGTASVGTAH